MAITQNEQQGIVRDTIQFLRLMEAKYLIVVDADVRQSLAESIGALIYTIAEHARELQE